MRLLDLPLNVHARLLSFDEVRAKLKQYGLYIGDEIRVVRVAPLGGPLLVEVNGREIALGRALAEKILVELK
ncbi:MAG: ferrous iron transport protein A [Chloroflexi bacterium]|nr:ferrous iron transport protein A [Chloroflexota bacterium]